MGARAGAITMDCCALDAAATGIICLAGAAAGAAAALPCTPVAPPELKGRGGEDGFKGASTLLPLSQEDWDFEAACDAEYDLAAELDAAAAREAEAEALLVEEADAAAGPISTRRLQVEWLA